MIWLHKELAIAISLRQIGAEATLIVRVTVRAMLEYIRISKWLIGAVFAIEIANTLLPFLTAFLTGIGINRLTQAVLHHDLSTSFVLRSEVRPGTGSDLVKSSCLMFLFCSVLCNYAKYKSN